MKTPWTISRTIYAGLSVVFAIVLLIGLYFLFAGSTEVQTSSTSNTPEDWSGVFGGIAEFIGFGLSVISGVLLLLFAGLYVYATRRLKSNLLKTKV